MLRLDIGALLLLLATTAAADGGAMKVDNAWARRAAMMEKGKDGGTGNGAVYLRIRNSGGKPDALVGASSDAAESVEIHETYRDMDMLMMRPVERLEIAPGKAVELKPGGYHLMLLNLKHDLKPGGSIGVILKFREAGQVVLKAPVK